MNSSTETAIARILSRRQPSSECWIAGRSLLQSKRRKWSTGLKEESVLELFEHRLHQYVLLSHFEPSRGPSADVLSKRLGAFVPVIAVHSTVGLWISVGITHCEQTDTVDIGVFNQFSERLE